MTRTDIINALIEKRGFKRYLEIGVDTGANFRAIKLPPSAKVGVDPKGGEGVMQMTSDQFFHLYGDKEKFDIVFIDGLHHSEQVYRDIVNSLKCLNDGGVIVCHDMNPNTEKMQVVPQCQGEWTGDCWKAWTRLRSIAGGLYMYVVDTDYGCGIIQRGSQHVIKSPDELTWNGLVKNRKEWLNLIFLSEFKARLELMTPTSDSTDEKIVASIREFHNNPIQGAPRHVNRSVCLTPTGDRPHALKLARKWFERARGDMAVDWLVIDDGIEPFDPGGCNYVRRTPDGPNSLGRQLTFAMPLCEAYDNILIWEDDDWYAPDRISRQLDIMNKSQALLHGWANSRYYHLRAKGILNHKNTMHSSLCETAFRREFIPKVLECIALNTGDLYYDLKMWRKYGGTLGLLSTDQTPVLGIKGGPGRRGYCPGHNEKNILYTPMALSALIGDDAKEYESWLK